MPGLGPAAKVLLFRQKDPTMVALFETNHALTLSSALSNRADVSYEVVAQLALLGQGPPGFLSLSSVGRGEGVGGREMRKGGFSSKDL